MATPQTLEVPKTIPKLLIEDLSLLDEVSARTAGVSRLECVSSAGRAAGLVPPLRTWITRLDNCLLCCEPGCAKKH